MTLVLSTPAEVLLMLGERLRLQRLTQGVPQRELAARAGLSLGALRKLERDGQCSLETLVRVVQALGLTAELDELFVPRRQSIAGMARAEAAIQRRRAPRQRPAG